MKLRSYVVTGYLPHIKHAVEIDRVQTYTEAMAILEMSGDTYALGKLERDGRKLAILVNGRVFVQGVPAEGVDG